MRIYTLFTFLITPKIHFPSKCGSVKQINLRYASREARLGAVGGLSTFAMSDGRALPSWAALVSLPALLSPICWQERSVQALPDWSTPTVCACTFRN